MKEKTIKKLIRLVEESDIDILEVSSWGRKIRITRKQDGIPSGNGSAQVVQASVAPKAIVQPTSEATPAPPVADDEKLIAIKSPMVGTFYAAPGPEAKVYVEPNQRVEKGQVVCIVEAMKLMNEIESDVTGRITKICVENAKPVEFGQTLFMVDPSG